MNMLLVLTVVVFFVLGWLSAMIYIMACRGVSATRPTRKKLDRRDEYELKLDKEVMKQRVEKGIDNTNASDGFVKH